MSTKEERKIESKRQIKIKLPLLVYRTYGTVTFRNYSAVSLRKKTVLTDYCCNQIIIIVFN